MGAGRKHGDGALQEYSDDMVNFRAISAYRRYMIGEKKRNGFETEPPRNL